MDNGGWHFTSIGSVEAIQKKIKSWSHRELNTSAVLSGVEYNVRHGYDIFRRLGFGRLECWPMDHKMLPSILFRLREQFKHLVGPEIEPENFFRRLFHMAYYFIRFKLNKASYFIRFKLNAASRRIMKFPKENRR